MKQFVLLGSAAAALLAAPLVAQQPARAPAASIARTTVEASVRDAFARFDSNRDGFVDTNEVQAARETRKAERSEKRESRRGERFTALDADRDGMISRAEFLAPRAAGVQENRAERRENRAERRERRTEQRAGRGSGFVRLGERAFARLDADNDNRVSLAEATEGALRRFDRLDADRNGTITREERRLARQARRG